MVIFLDFLVQFLGVQNGRIRNLGAGRGTESTVEHYCRHFIHRKSRSVQWEWAVCIGENENRNKQKKVIRTLQKPQYVNPTPPKRPGRGRLFGIPFWRPGWLSYGVSPFVQFGQIICLPLGHQLLGGYFASPRGARIIRHLVGGHYSIIWDKFYFLHH